MELVYRRREKIVGAFVLSVLLLLFSTVVLIGRGKNWFETHVEYYAIFDESYNLQKNSAVKLQKTDIGRVKQIVLTGNKVRVDIAVLEKYQSQITRGSHVTVKSPTIIGDEYLALELGAPQAPVIPEGSQIPSMPKKSIADILNEFQVEETAKKLVTVIQNIAELTEIFKDPQGPLVVSLQELETSLANISAATKRAPETMDLVNANLVTYQKIGDEVYVHLADIKKVLGTLEQSLQNLKNALANVETASDDFPRITGSTRQGIGELRQTLDEVERIVHSLQQNYFIRGNLPPVPEAEPIDAGLRE
ncbi:MAG: MlaD family protein [Desulfosudaceae bacterium]